MNSFVAEWQPLSHTEGKFVPDSSATRNSTRRRVPSTGRGIAVCWRRKPLVSQTSRTFKKIFLFLSDSHLNGSLLRFICPRDANSEESGDTNLSFPLNVAPSLKKARFPFLDWEIIVGFLFIPILSSMLCNAWQFFPTPTKFFLVSSISKITLSDLFQIEKMGIY